MAGVAPLLSVVVPTIGRPGLARTLASIRAQVPPAVCEILVVGDTHQGTFAADLARVPGLCREHAARYLGHDGGQHCVGQPQRQAGMAWATGGWLTFTQDDNAWATGAWAALRQACLWGVRGPHLFRAETTHGGTVWREPVLAYGNADADGILVPREAARLGAWAPHYAGDWDFLRETVALWDGQLVFKPALVVVKQREAA